MVAGGNASFTVPDQCTNGKEGDSRYHSLVTLLDEVNSAVEPGILHQAHALATLKVCNQRKRSYIHFCSRRVGR